MVSRDLNIDYLNMRKIADYAFEQEIDIENLHEKIKESEINSEISRILDTNNEKFKKIALEKSILPLWQRGNIKINGVEPGQGADFPLDAIRDFTKKVLIVRAGTGSGKSTQIPQALAQKGKKVILTQPRILTTVGIAERIADEMNVQIGTIVGYTTGGPKLKSKNTRLEVVTEGILLLRPNESFKNIDYVVLDEVHERGLNLDLLFLKFKKLLGEYPRLKLIVMSATLDPDKFGKYFENSSFAEIEGTTADIDIDWPKEVIEDYPSVIISKITTNVEKGNILVFLPTRVMISEIRESLIRKINEYNYDHAVHGLLIAELYSGIGSQGEDLAKLSLDELPDVLSASGKKPTRKVILATNVAETGITFVGLTFVIDSGWTNRPYYNPYVDTGILMLDSITQGQALQRWGRVGRKAPGKVIPMYTKEQFLQMDNNDVNREDVAERIGIDNVERTTNATGAPAVITQNLDTFMLHINGDYSTEGLLDMPSTDSVARSLDTLWNLGAVESNGKLTELGKFMKRFKYPPKHSRMLYEAISERCVEEIAVIVSMMLIGLDKLIDSKKFKGDCLMNQYYSDHVNLWFIYQDYSRHRIDIEWCIENGYKCSAFGMIDEEVLGIKNTIIQEGLPIFVQKDTLESKIQRIKNCVKAGLILNVANQLPDEKGIYVSQRFKNVSGQVDFTSKAFKYANNASELFPEMIVYDSANLTRNRRGFMQYKFNMVTMISKK